MRGILDEITVTPALDGLQLDCWISRRILNGGGVLTQSDLHSLPSPINSRKMPPPGTEHNFWARWNHPVWNSWKPTDSIIGPNAPLRSIRPFNYLHAILGGLAGGPRLPFRLNLIQVAIESDPGRRLPPSLHSWAIAECKFSLQCIVNSSS